MNRTATARPRRPASPRSTSSSTSTAPGATTSPPASASTTTCSTAFARHALVDLVVHTAGDTHIDAHHTVEDTAIVLGQAIREALGDKVGIRRFGDATVPLDEALVQAVVDVSGRPYCVHTGEPDGQAYVVIGGDTGPGFSGSLTRHVFETLAVPRPPRAARAGAVGSRPAPPGRGAVQGVRPGVPRRGRARPARDGRALDQGRALSAPASSSSTTARATCARPCARSSAPAPRSR